MKQRFCCYSKYNLVYLSSSLSHLYIYILVTDLQKLKAQAYRQNDVAATAKRRELNDRMMLAERGFLDSQGIKGKEWFKHLVSQLKHNITPS